MGDKMKLLLEYDYAAYLNFADEIYSKFIIDVNDSEHKFISDTLKNFEIVQRILEKKISEQKILKKHVQENQSE